MLYHVPKAVVTDEFLFTGGGGYFGGVLELRYTFYFLKYGITFYDGGEVELSLVPEFGVAVDDGKQIVLNDPSQDFFDDLLSKTHFEFLVRSILTISTYIGPGVAGFIGVRGGFQLVITFINNPFEKKKYPNVRPLGFSGTGDIKIWVDAVLVSIPIQIFQWPYPYNLGYFEDVEDIFPDKTNYASDDYDFELQPRPRFGEDSVFVANDNSEEGLFGGTYEINKTKNLITNIYDVSEPQFNLDDDHSRGDDDRTVLRYILYYGSTDTWTEPQNVWDGNSTADFYQNLCDCGDKILISFASRPNTVNDNSPKKELLKYGLYISINQRELLMFGFEFTDKQAQSIVDMRLRALTSLELNKLKEKYDKKTKKIAYYKEILSDNKKLYEL